MNLLKLVALALVATILMVGCDSTPAENTTPTESTSIAVEPIAAESTMVEENLNETDEITEVPAQD